jgi:hypothetical protein
VPQCINSRGTRIPSRFRGRKCKIVTLYNRTVTDPHGSEGENPRQMLAMQERDSYARPTRPSAGWCPLLCEVRTEKLHQHY